jgi:hypothetical protein
MIVNPEPIATAQASQNVSCFGGNDGVATVSVTSGTAPFAYSWTSGATGATATGLSAGTYTVTVTDSKGCQTQTGVVITEPSQLAATTSSVDANCATSTDGTASISVSGGTAPYNYQWSNGATVAINNNVAAGTYSVTVTDANGCIINKSVTVNYTDNTAPNAVCKNITVQLNSNGQASITAQDIDNGSTDNCGIANITVSPASFDCSDLGSNTVTLRVEDVNGNVSTCSAIVTVEDKINPTITNVPSNITVTANSNDCTPSVIWTVPNADDNCSVTMTGSHNSGDDFAIGTTTVTYTAVDPSGNKATASFNVTVVSTTLTASVSQNDVSCNGLADGSATVTVAGGCLPYSYSWSNAATTTTTSGLSAGTYTVTATDANGKTVTKSVTITEPAQLVATVYGSDPTCATGTDGVAIASASGGTAPYTYSWSNSQTTATINNLSSGSYSVTVTDANGCTATGSITIARPACCNVTSAGAIGNGQENCGPFDPATITSTSLPSGGLGGVEYVWMQSTVNVPNTVGNPYWTPVANSNSPTLDPGYITQTTYYIRCSRSIGCSFYAGESNVIAMVVNSSPDVLISATDEICTGGTNGAADITVTGGEAPYSFAWTKNGNAYATTEDITGLTGGTYEVTVTDANGCTTTVATTITEKNGFSITSTITDATCFDGNDGSIDISINGGTTTTTTANIWEETFEDNSLYATSDNGQTEWTRSVISGSGYASVTSNNGGKVFQMSNNQSKWYSETIDISSYTDVDVSVELGSVQGNQLESSGSFQDWVKVYYELDGVWKQFPTNGYHTGQLSSSNIYATLNDVNGHDLRIKVWTRTTSSNEYYFVDNVTLTATTTSTGNYNFNWSNAATTEDVTNLTAGTYTVVVTDQDGCTVTETFTVNQGAAISLSADVTGVSCQPVADCSNGVKSVKVKFTGSDGSKVIAKDKNGNKLGEYTVSYGDEFTVEGSSNLDDKIELCIVDDCNEVTVEGKNKAKKCTPATEATFHCDNSVTTTSTKDLSNVVLKFSDGSDYKFDNLNCGKSKRFSYQNKVIVGVWIKSGCNSSGDGPGYGEWIANPNSGPTEVCHELLLNCNNGIIGSSIDVYEVVEYKDGSGTSTNSNNPQPVCDGAIDLTISGGTAPYTITWVDGSDKEDRDELCAGDYIVNVTDANGCGQSLTVSVQQDQCCNVTSAGTIAQDQSNCGAFDPNAITSTADATGGAGSLEYKWMVSTTTDVYTSNGSNWTEVSGATGATYDPSTISTSTYFVRLAKRTGCTVWLASNVVSLQINPVPTIAINQLVAPNCNGQMATLKGTIDGSFTSFDWSLDGAPYPNPSLDLVNAGPGTYTLTVYSGNCSTSTTYTVLVASAPVITGNVTNASATTTTTSCDCEGRMRNFTVRYDGSSSNATIRVYNKKQDQLIKTYTGVNKGDYITVNGFDKDDRLESKTFLRVNNGSYIEIHTSCSIDILNETYGDFYVYSYTDGDGNYCNGGANLGCNPDLDALKHGEVITNQFQSAGITITALSNGNYRDELIIFDTDKSSTSDPDLEVNIGNIIIFPENNKDNDNDGVYDDPDDQAVGGRISLYFNNSRIVKSFKFVDSENNKGRVYCYDASNTLLSTTTIANAGDASVQTVQVNTSDVKKMIIEFTTSGGVADFQFDCPSTGSCDGEIDLAVSGGSAPYSYSWTNSATSEDLTGLCPGTYTVTVTDANGCTSEKTFTVDRSQDNKDSRSRMSNKDQLINGNEFENASGLISGISSLSAYPNPANSQTTVNYILNNSAQARVVLTDLSGKELVQVYEGFVEGGVSQQNLVDLSILRSGVYMIVISSSANERLLERIVIAR